ncbi:hypothetical protein C0J52_10451 [Blattella germanica]|nr:hypothetical protein C0J52_10451 [Blattella germanica]
MNVNEQEIRAVAEALLTASSQSQSPAPAPVVHSQPAHHGHGRISTEGLFTGMRRDGRMSVLNGDDITSALEKQVIHYNIHASLFDIVMAAVCRFTILLLFYALLYVNHWFVIAWTSANQPVFHVLLVLISFVLSWGEAWFLDFRVIPQEIQALEYLQAMSSYPESERTPLLRNYLQSLTQADNYTESIGNFYSPMDSPQSSDDEGDARRSVLRSRIAGGPTAQIMNYKRQGQEVLEDSWRTLNSSDWKLEKQTQEGDTIQSKKLPHGTKVLKLQGIVNFSPQALLTELFHNVGNLPKWNPSILETRTIQVIDDHTDISYQVGKEAGGGIVSSRDFVILRHWAIKDGCYISAGVSVPHPNVPPVKKYIRGENGPTCWVMRPIEGDPDHCVFEWLLNIDLKGWLPNYVVVSALSTAMLEYIGHIRTHAEELKNASLYGEIIHYADYDAVVPLIACLIAYLEARNPPDDPGGGSKEQQAAAADFSLVAPPPTPAVSLRRSSSSPNFGVLGTDPKRQASVRSLHRPKPSSCIALNFVTSSLLCCVRQKLLTLQRKD